MKVEFAPLNIPLARRLQTAAVLQWVLSFLLLGKDSRPRKIRAKHRGAWGSVSPLPDITTSLVSQSRQVTEGICS